MAVTSHAQGGERIEICEVVETHGEAVKRTAGKSIGLERQGRGSAMVDGIAMKVKHIAEMTTAITTITGASGNTAPRRKGAPGLMRVGTKADAIAIVDGIMITVTTITTVVAQRLAGITIATTTGTAVVRAIVTVTTTLREIVPEVVRENVTGK